MSDTPVTAVAAAPAGPPAAAATLPTPPRPAASQSVAQEDRFVVPFPDGREEVVTPDQLAEAYRSVRSRPSVEPEVLELATLMDKAAKGDQEAVRKVMEKVYGVPKAPDAPPDPPAIAVLKKEVEDLKTALGSVAPTVEQINEAKNIHNLDRLIETNKDKFPFLSRSPQRAQEAYQMWNQALNLVRSRGVDPAALNTGQLETVAGFVLKTLEDKLQITLKAFGVQVPANGTSRPPVMVDDQNRPIAPASRSPRYVTLPDGKIYDTSSGRFVTQTAYGEFISVPDAPTTPAGGTDLGMNPAAPAGPRTVEVMKQQIRNRMAQINAGGTV